MIRNPTQLTVIRKGIAIKLTEEITFVCLATLCILSGCASSQSDDKQNQSISQLRLQAESMCLTQLGDDQDLPAIPFTTDGCSAWPDGNWHSCCVQHDMAYWCGGENGKRFESDLQLQHCVAAKGHPITAVVMKWGTRIGGSENLPFPWRWGYGREYKFK